MPPCGGYPLSYPSPYRNPQKPPTHGKKSGMRAQNSTNNTRTQIHTDAHRGKLTPILVHLCGCAAVSPQEVFWLSVNGRQRTPTHTQSREEGAPCMPHRYTRPPSVLVSVCGGGWSAPVCGCVCLYATT